MISPHPDKVTAIKTVSKLVKMLSNEVTPWFGFIAEFQQYSFISHPELPQFI